MTKSYIGYVMILLSTIGFGSYGVWSRFLGEDLGIFYQGWVRSAIVLIVLIPLALLTKSLKPIDPSDRKWIFIPVIFGIFTQAPLYYAFNHMDIGTATLIFYGMFLITSYAVGKIFLSEKITSIKLVSLLLAIIGLLLLFGFSLAKFSLLALLLAVINGVASGGEVATTKKSSEKYSSLQISIYVWAGILLTHLPLSLLFQEKQIPLAWDFMWFSMFAFALVGLTAFWLVVEGYKYVDASIGGLIGLLEVIFGVVFGLLLFGEQLISSVIFGGGLILLAAMLPDLQTLRKRYNKKTV